MTVLSPPSFVVVAVVVVSFFFFLLGVRFMYTIVLVPSGLILVFFAYAFRSVVVLSLCEWLCILGGQA